MMHIKRYVLAIFAALALSTQAWAAGPELNVNSVDLAVGGYDPVAYFTEKKATKGDYRITAKHNGAIYWFASKENRTKFKENPDAYLPAYGGYCAFGAAQGYKFHGDPEQWSVVDNKLYLNLGPSVKKRWEGEVEYFITEADKKWGGIKGKTPQELRP